MGNHVNVNDVNDLQLQNCVTWCKSKLKIL
jgi:hypothetical protein